MTLTSRLPDPAFIHCSLAELFVPLAMQPFAVDAICVFEQQDREAPFLLTGRYPLQGKIGSNGLKRA